MTRQPTERLHGSFRRSAAPVSERRRRAETGLRQRPTESSARWITSSSFLSPHRTVAEADHRTGPVGRFGQPVDAHGRQEPGVHDRGDRYGPATDPTSGISSKWVEARDRRRACPMGSSAISRCRIFGVRAVLQLSFNRHVGRSEQQNKQTHWAAAACVVTFRSSSSDSCWKPPSPDRPVLVAA